MTISTLHFSAKNISVIAALMGVGTLGLSGAWWVAHIVRNPPVPYFEDQAAILQARADVAKPGGTLIIGDSIVARNHLPQLCGREALNAGVPWSTSHDWQGLAQDLIRRARPSVVVLALGNNDKREDWRADYTRLAKMATVAVTPKQPEKAAFIRDLLPSVPVPTQTYDGTHLTAEGALEWTRRVESLCVKQGLVH